MIIRVASSAHLAGARKLVGENTVEFVPFIVPHEIKYRPLSDYYERRNKRPFRLTRSLRNFATLDAAVAALIKEQA